MHVYRLVIRYLFAVIFVLGGIVHLVMGRTAPQGYAAFGETALIPWLAELWGSFVMPNIGWLTVLTGLFELLCGTGLTQKRYVRISTLAIIGFLVFVTTLGYGFPTTGLVQDFLKNRVITIGMILMLLPLLFTDKREEDEDNVGLVH